MDRHSMNEPPSLLSGESYPEWKIKMEHFIKAIFGIEAWMLIINGWSPPTLENGKGRKTEKPFEFWTESEIRTCTLNSRALNAIFSSIDQQIFKYVAFCETAKEAWETLQTVYGKNGRLQDEALYNLESKFCRMKMSEQETISRYYDRLVNITYEARTLGKTYSNDKLVDKVLWSLPDKFTPKVVAISDNSKGSLMLGDLISNLKAYEERLRHQR